jgi:hypothetical protein
MMLILVLLFAFATTEPTKTIIVEHLDSFGITVFDPTENDQVWKALGRE